VTYNCVLELVLITRQAYIVGDNRCNQNKDVFMTISKGATLPDATLLFMGEEGPASVQLSEKLTDRKVVIFGLPGAYTGVCTTSHVPSFMRTKDDFAAKGVDEIICVSVNDPFVMQAWGESTGAAEAGITMLGDADGAFTKAIGMDFSAPPAGLIGRSKRYAMVVDNGVVTALGEESSPGECDISGGESLLEMI
jgi:peroxiredoxin